MDKVLSLIRDAGNIFYLTGGTALSRVYLHHRHSDDLDLFVNDAPDFRRQASATINVLESAFKLTIGNVSDRFVRIFLHEEHLTLKVDMVNDISVHFGEWIKAPFFERIDSWRNILSNKLCTLSRADAKDIADILFIAYKFPYQWEEIFSEAQQKDLWVEPLSVARLIKTFPLNQLDFIKWAKPIDMDKIKSALTVMHDDIFFGKSNSLADKHIL
jgi:hypothetical protein